MWIKFLHSISSAEGWAYPPGKPVDFPNEEQAANFIKSGIAVACTPPVIETADLPTPENTAVRTAKKR